MARRTQGTAVWVVAPTVADPTKFELLKIGCPQNFKPGTDSKSKIDTTCLEAEEFKSNMLGLAELGQATFDLKVEPSNASHVRLKQLEEAGAELTWIVGWAGKEKGQVKTIVPTITPDGNVTLPTGRSWNKFKGYVESFPMDFETDSAVSGTVTVQRTTKVDWIPETAA